MTHKGPFQPLLFCDSVIPTTSAGFQPSQPLCPAAQRWPGRQRAGTAAPTNSPAAAFLLWQRAAAPLPSERAEALRTQKSQPQGPQQPLPTIWPASTFCFKLVSLLFS